MLQAGGYVTLTVSLQYLHSQLNLIFDSNSVERGWIKKT